MKMQTSAMKRYLLEKGMHYALPQRLLSELLSLFVELVGRMMALSTGYQINL
jgi:hypothetical protein